MEEGDGGDGGDGGKVPEVVEQDGWSWTVASDATISSADVSKVSILAFGRISIFVTLAFVGMVQSWMTNNMRTIISQNLS